MSFYKFLTDSHPNGLGIELTHAQQVWVRVAFDHEEPSELEGDDLIVSRQLFGDITEKVPDLARATLAMLKGARVGGSWIGSLFLLYRAFRADLSRLAPGEHGFGLIIAPDLRLAGQDLRYVKGAAKQLGLDRMIASETTNEIVFQRNDGRFAAIACVPASRGGSASRGRTLSLGVLLDEAAFFRDPDSGVVNDSEIFRSVAPRVPKGGKVLLISTAWAEAGLLWDLTQKNHGNPTTALACRAPTSLMRLGDELLLGVIAAERERDPENAAREYDCIPFTDSATSFFDSQALKGCVNKDRPLVLDPQLAAPGTISLCAADLGFRSDASAAVVLHVEPSGLVRFAEHVELRPEKGRPLSPEFVFSEIAGLAKRHSCTSVISDIHYVESLREDMRKAGLDVFLAPGGITGKLAAHTAARNAIHEGRVELPELKRLVEQLSEVSARPTPGGQLQISARRKRGSHGDLASAFILALWGVEHIRIAPKRQPLAIPEHISMFFNTNFGY